MEFLLNYHNYDVGYISLLSLVDLDTLHTFLLIGVVLSDKSIDMLCYNL